MFFRRALLIMLATIYNLVSGVPTMGWGSLNSTAIDYDTFNAILKSGTVPYIGPKGLYTRTNDLGMVYVDMAPEGELTIADPTWRDALIAHLLKDPPGGLDFLDTTGHGRLEVRQFALCKEICSAPGHISTCYTCSCHFKSRTCHIDRPCVEIWTC